MTGLATGETERMGRGVFFTTDNGVVKTVGAILGSGVKVGVGGGQRITTPGPGPPPEEGCSAAGSRMIDGKGVGVVSGVVEGEGVEVSMGVSVGVVEGEGVGVKDGEASR